MQFLFSAQIIMLKQQKEQIWKEAEEPNQEMKQPRRRKAAEVQGHPEGEAPT